MDPGWGFGGSKSPPSLNASFSFRQKTSKSSAVTHISKSLAKKIRKKI